MRIHVPEPLESYSIHPYFSFLFPDRPKQRGLFQENLPNNYFEHEVEYVNDIDAEAIVLANNFNRLTAPARAHIKRCADRGEELHIPVFVFANADFANKLSFDPRVYVFRYSLYRRTKTKHDIMTPTLVEDLGRTGITLKEKEGVPLVTFCGRAGFPRVRARINYVFYLLLYSFLAIFIPKIAAEKLGVYWRTRALAACSSSSEIRTHFIIRQTYSGHPSSIELDPEVARKEFIESIVEADFVLAPKGDGNYSNRFQEALSLARLPAYIETDSYLPLEGIVDYDRVMVRIPMENIGRTPRYIRAFYDALSAEEFKERQKEAREIFENYVRPDAFYRYVFTQALPEGRLSELNP